MRILHVIPTLRLRDGGPAKVLLEICEYLNGVGHQTAIYTTDLDGDGGRALSSTAKDINIKFFPVCSPRAFKFSPSFARAIRRDIAQFDIVHINSLYLFPSTLAAHYARRYRVPYIVRPHGTLDPYIYKRHRGRKLIYEMLFERRNLEMAAAVHFTSDEEMRLASSLGLRLRGAVVPLGVKLGKEPADDSRGALLEAYPELRGKKILLFLGRLTAKKGLDILLKAFGMLCRVRSDVHLLIAGPDEEGYGPKVREWQRAEGVTAHVTFAGMLLGERKAMALAGADIFVLPSYSENFGNAVVEAMAAGLPVIISNKVNIWRQIADAGAGRVIDCDAGELYSELIAILDDAQQLSLMGRQARKLVGDEFTWEVAGARLVGLYRDVLSGFHGDTRSRFESSIVEN